MNQLLNKNYSESKYRKDYQQGLRYLKNTDQQELLDQLEIEKKKIHRLNTLRNKQIRELAQRELILETIEDSILPYKNPTPRLTPNQNQQQQQQHTGHILTLADAHFGRKKENTKDKLNTILTETEQYVKETGVNPETPLTVQFLGDMVDGLLRTSQFQFIELMPLDQVFELSDLLADFLYRLSKITPLRVFYTTSSNHSEIRPLNANRLDFKTEDYERIIVKFLQTRLPYLQIHSDPILEYQIGDFNILALHGHQVNKKDSIIKNQKKVYDYIYYGHYHHENQTYERIGVPAIADPDEYALYNAGVTPPQVLIDAFTDKGRVNTRRIILKEVI